MTTTLPAFTRNLRRPSPDEVVRPLSPTLARAVADEPAAIEHAKIAERYSEKRTLVASLTAKHEQALAEDEEERKAALLDPERKARAPKAEKVAVELEQARSDLELLGGMLDESSRGLLAATLPFVRAAHVEVSDRRVEAFVD